MLSNGDHQLDVHGNLVDMQGNVVVPCRVVEQFRATMRYQYQNDQRQARGNPARFAPIGSRNTNFAATTAASARTGPAGAHAAHFVATSPLDSPSGDRVGVAIPGSDGSPHDAFTSAPHAQPHLVTTFAPQQPASGVPYGPVDWLPQGNNLPTDSTYSAAWLSAQQSFGLDFGQSPQQRSTPTIKITTDFSGAHAHNFLQPQEAIHSAPSSASSLPPDPSYYPPYHSGHLSPQVSPYMDENMQTPVSPVSVHEASMTDPQLTRKRSHSVMSQQQEHPLVNTHSRSGSIASIAITPGEEYSPRGSRAFKRGDPPTNMDNKYICDFAEECRGQVFDRKCEWSKHMDKHDRPYRCPHPSCAKLQGFTYSGGLLRHEREVHGKHGGPKAQLMCPHEDCKRHSGKGFTRRENLNEHLRRVHSAKESQSQVSTYRREGMEAIAGVDDAETPASALSEAANLEELAAISPVLGKRKRSLAEHHDRSASESMDDLLTHEVKRLQGELASKEEIIRQLQANLLQQAEESRRLKDVISNYAQQSSQG